MNGLYEPDCRHATAVISKASKKTWLLLEDTGFSEALS
jgi:hypothetical protein